MVRVKKVHVLISSLIVISIYFTFQLLFVNDLRNSLINLETSTNQPETQSKLTEILIPLDSNQHPFLIFILPFYHKKNSYNFSTIQVYTKHPESNIKRQINPNIRGINTQNAHLYSPDGLGLFKCLNSNQQVPFDSINDNYCDCIDGTDEPGSNACQFYIFYCSLQNEYLPNNFIPSSRVDDKICDCCDGSDESPETGCKNKCNEKIKTNKNQAVLNKNALAEKRNYLVDGMLKNEQIYGPKGVFYKLSQKCFTIKKSEYTFEVCPYNKCTQTKTDQIHLTTNIGVKPSLTLVGETWVLLMKNGDSSLCPEPRQSNIQFECGISDELISVQEPQKCLYQFHLKTPAAC